MTTHVRFYRLGCSHIGRPGFAKFLATVAPLFEHIDLCVPVFEQLPPPNYVKIDLDNISICELPPYFERIEAAALRRPVSLIRALWPRIRKADVVWILLPNYLSIVVWFVCLLQGKKVAIRMVGDWPRMVELAFSKRGIHVLGKVCAGAHKLLLHAMVRSSNLTLTTGAELARTYGRGVARTVPFVSSTISEYDLSSDLAGSGSDDRHILFVGRLDPYKGVRELLIAARDLLAEGLRVRIRLVGDGSHAQELRELAIKLGIADRVDWRGWVAMGPDLQREYRTADVLALPSYAEGSPKVVIEAMANGLPVVASRVGAVPIVVQAGTHGLIIPPQDASALRDALRIVLSDEPLRRRMAAAGPDRARQFTMEAERELVGRVFKQFGLLPRCNPIEVDSKAGYNAII